MADNVVMDTTRNEVQIDLDKFMAMSEEISELKDKLREATDPELQDKRNPWCPSSVAVGQ